MSNFPTKIKSLRIAKGLTQKQLATSLHVSQNAIYNWENGKREPNFDMLKRIAKTFDIALYILLDDGYEIPDITSEAWKKRARIIGDTEMAEPPKPFTQPLNSKYNSIETSSYDSSYSYASSEEDLIRILEQRQKTEEETLLADYRKLNKQGQSEARKRIKELREIKKYSDMD